MMKKSTIISASLFVNRQTGSKSVWCKLQNGEAVFINLKIAQNNLDTALITEDADLTLHEGCGISYRLVQVKKGDTYLDAKGQPRKGAGTYSKDQTISVDVEVDYTSAKAENRALQANAKQVAKLTSMFSSKAKAPVAAVVEEEVEADGDDTI